VGKVLALIWFIDDEQAERCPLLKKTVFAHRFDNKWWASPTKIGAIYPVWFPAIPTTAFS
jgi:hypothetical protein